MLSQTITPNRLRLEPPFRCENDRADLRRLAGWAVLKELRTPLYSIRLYRRVAGQGDEVTAPQCVVCPIEVPLPTRIEKSIVWDGIIMMRSQARAGEKASRVPILAYHSVADTGPEEDEPVPGLRRVFPAADAHLRRHGFDSISLQEWADSIAAKRPIPGRPVIITFDDGYSDFLWNAWPVLDRADFSATVFVVTDHVGGRPEIGWGLGDAEFPHLMSWEDLSALRDRGVDIQSHTASHRDLLKLTEEQILHEGLEARRKLREQLGIEASSIAFPYGRSNPDIAAVLSRSGYHLGLTTRSEVSTFRG